LLCVFYNPVLLTTRSRAVATEVAAATVEVPSLAKGTDNLVIRGCATLRRTQYANFDSTVLLAPLRRLILCNRTSLAKPNDGDPMQLNVLADQIALDTFCSTLAQCVVEGFRAPVIRKAFNFDRVTSVEVRNLS